MGERECAGIAATAELARDGHVVIPAGINLENYRKNPIVLFSHDPEVPIATCSAIGMAGKDLAVRFQFPPAGASAAADQTLALVKAGVLRGVSIGFDPTDCEPLDARRPRGGQLIKECELLEISIVSVPADTGASITERALTRSASQIRKLPALPEWAMRRATAQVRNRGAQALLNPTMHVWALLQIEEDKLKALSFEQRQADKRALQRAGRELGIPEPEPLRPSYRKPNSSWAFH